MLVFDHTKTTIETRNEKQLEKTYKCTNVGEFAHFTQKGVYPLAAEFEDNRLTLFYERDIVEPLLLGEDTVSFSAFLSGDRLWALTIAILKMLGREDLQTTDKSMVIALLLLGVKWKSCKPGNNQILFFYEKSEDLEKQLQGILFGRSSGASTGDINKAYRDFRLIKNMNGRSNAEILPAVRG